jgi:hypothetical protein
MEAAPTTWISEEQLRALVTPRTREVFECFRAHGPMAVGGLQKLLGSESKTLYYQVAKLVRAALLVEAGSSKGTRRERMIYRAIEGNLLMPEGFQGAQYELLAAKGVTAQLKKTIRTFRMAAERSSNDESLVSDLFVVTTNLHLTPLEVTELKLKMSALLEDFRKRDSPHGRKVAMISVMTPHSSRL